MAFFAAYLDFQINMASWFRFAGFPGLLPLLLAGQAALGQPPTPGDDAAPARELSRREAAVESMRGELGLYHPALREAYGELGGYYLELGDYQQSLATYQDALEVARINEGLRSESQLRIIDAMIAGNEGLADWQSVDDLHHFRHHMASRLWELTDSRHLSAISAFGGWKMRAIRDGLLNESAWGARAVIDEVGSAYRRAIAALDREGGDRPLALADMVHGKAELDLHMMAAVANTPYDYFPATAPRFVNQMRCRMVRGPNGQPVQRCVNVQVENPRYRNSQRDNKRMALTRYSNAISNGIERLTAIRDSGAGLPDEALAQIDSQIAELEAQYQEYARRGRRDFLF